jgi:two-component system nitrogen regulation sensor histidine kinase GlnL
MDHTEERAAQIIDHLATSVLLFDENLHLVSINSAGESLLSMSSKRIIGMTPEKIWPNTMFFSDMIRKSFQFVRTRIERGVEMSLINRDSVKVDCIFTPIVINDETKEIIVELVGVDTFVREMQEFNHQTVQKIAKESVQGMAHEIKNPLGGIRGAAQLMEKELDDESLLEYTKIIINESDRLRNFLDRMMAANTHPVRSDTNIHEIIEYVISIIRVESSRNLHIEKDYDPSIPTINADREQLIQAVLNLLRNAVQATTNDERILLKTRIQRQITIQNKLNKLAIQLDIIDNGPGIPTEIESGAFYPMVTGHAEGTGLGLSIAQQLIQSHGGIINYDRKENNTYFSILFPIECNNAG